MTPTTQSLNFMDFSPQRWKFRNRAAEPNDFPHIRWARCGKRSEQHDWSHRSRRHQPSAAQTNEHNRYLKLLLVTRQCRIRRLFQSRRRSAEKSSSPNRRGNIDEGVFQLMRTIYANGIHYMQGRQKCSDIHSDINCDEGGDSAWWKQIKDLYPRLKGSSCYSNRVVHHKRYVSPRKADGCITELMLAF